MTSLKDGVSRGVSDVIAIIINPSVEKVINKTVIIYIIYLFTPKYM